MRSSPAPMTEFQDPIIALIRNDLIRSADEQTKAGFQRFFKEEVKHYGVKTASVTAIAKKYWREVKKREKTEIFALCEELYASGYCEEAFVVSTWAAALHGRYAAEDLPVFSGWIERYITNWAMCDGFCNHTIGAFMEEFPEFLPELKRWAVSPNRWMRRAAAVSLIIPAKHGKFPDEALEIAGLLLTDTDDMVQKGYGWLLKEVSRKHQQRVYEYVLERRQIMPRTALRYAIELMPKEMRIEAMKKDPQKI